MPNGLLNYFLIPWAVVLIGVQYFVGYFLKADADMVWYVDALSTKLLVIVLVICLIHRHKAFLIVLVVVSLITLYQAVDILTIDKQSILHLVGYNG